MIKNKNPHSYRNRGVSIKGVSPQQQIPKNGIFTKID
tara:strand:+ start:295 stop:405 length:111 start_codon:yes stop_codon:yes gene_type:complete